MVTTTPWLERKDDTILLTGERMSPEAVERYVNPLIQQRLQVLLQDGWEADGAADVLTLWRHGCLACREHSTFWMDKRTYTLSSVTVRLRRISTA